VKSNWFLCRLKLESEVKDKEDDNEVFDLKKTSLDNLFYFSYGEPFPPCSFALQEWGERGEMVFCIMKQIRYMFVQGFGIWMQPLHMEVMSAKGTRLLDLHKYKAQQQILCAGNHP